jgi:hypothetical protein
MGRLSPGWQERRRGEGRRGKTQEQCIFGIVWAGQQDREERGRSIGARKKCTSGRVRVGAEPPTLNGGRLFQRRPEYRKWGRELIGRGPGKGEGRV